MPCGLPANLDIQLRHRIRYQQPTILWFAKNSQYTFGVYIYLDFFTKLGGKFVKHGATRGYKGAFQLENREKK